jgi:hypothetical protein
MKALELIPRLTPEVLARIDAALAPIHYFDLARRFAHAVVGR